MDKNYTNFRCQSVYKPFKLSKPQKCNHLNFHAPFRAFHFERRSSFEKFILQLVNLFLLCLSRFRCVAGYSARFNDANSSDIRCRLWTTSAAAKFKTFQSRTIRTYRRIKLFIKTSKKFFLAELRTKHTKDPPSLGTWPWCWLPGFSHCVI